MGVAGAKPRQDEENRHDFCRSYAFPKQFCCTGGGNPAGLGGQMLDAVFKALGQMFSPPFRSVLLKSVGLAIAFLALVAIGLFRLLEWLSGAGTEWLAAMFGPAVHGPPAGLGFIVAIALGLGLFTGAVPPTTAMNALAANFFDDA